MALLAPEIIQSIVAASTERPGLGKGLAERQRFS
jgi:hypothetical protein